MSEHPDTPNPTEQEAADALYASIYGAPQPAELSTEDQDLYTQLFPNN